MPVSDSIIFGPSPPGANTYGDIRKLGEADQFLAIRDRIGTFFNAQVNELSVQAGGKKKVYSPFTFKNLHIDTSLILFSLHGKEIWNEKSAPTEADEKRKMAGFVRDRVR